VVHMQTITLQDAEPVPLVDETLTPLDAVLHDPELGAALHVRGVGYCLEERANGNVGHYQTSPPNPLSDAQRGGEYGSLQDSKSPLHAMERGFRGGVKYLVSLPMNYLHSCPPTITPAIEPPLLRVTVTADALLD